MKIIFLLLLIVFGNCYDAKKENPNYPLKSLFINNTINPYPIPSYSISFLSKDLPGTAVVVKKFNSTYYALIENETNTNLLTLYTSTNALDFSSTGQTINTSNFSNTGGSIRFFFSHNSILYYASFSNLSYYTDVNTQNIVSTSTYRYYTYSNGSFSSLQTKTIPSIAGISASSSYDPRCISSLNNQIILLNNSNLSSNGSTTYGNSIWTGDLQNNTFSNLTSSPSFSGPRTTPSCSQIDSTIYMYGGYKYGCSSGSCQYTDLWSSTDGSSYIKVSSNFNYFTGNLIKLNNGTFLAVSSINSSGYKSTDNGANWSSIVITSGSTTTGVITASSLSVGSETDGSKVFIYSPTKVYYGTIP